MTNHRCQPGQFAVVTRCDNKRRLGLVVRIVKRHDTPEFDWVVELGVPITGFGAHARTRSSYRQAVAFDWNLTPLEKTVVSIEEVAHA